MGQQLYLHIGDCKTGSTVIQTMLANGHATPKTSRLFYPDKLAHGRLVLSLGRKRDIYPKPWRQAAKLLAKTPWDVAVLSSELFEFSNPVKVATAIRDHLPEHSATLKVITYIRPHIARVLSQFAENLKLGHSTGEMADFVATFLENDRLNYTARLARWQAEFGDRLIVRPFLRDFLAGGDVRRDFLHQILGDEDFDLKSTDNNNPSLGLPDLALLRLLQRRFEQADVALDNRVTFGKLFGRLLHNRPAHEPTQNPTQNPTQDPTQKLALPRTLYHQIAEQCRRDAQQMDQQWVGAPCFEPALEQAENATVDQPQSLEAQDYHAPETLRQTQVWADLILRQMGDAPSDFTKRLRPNQPLG